MNNAVLVTACLVALAAPVAADGQKEADRLFKSGVALFKEGKFAEALAEFTRAYEIAPHPLVLYNIAGCHRELSHYAEAVAFYQKFLTQAPGKVPAARLTAARTELDGILARIARVTVTIAGVDGATLVVDGEPLGTLLEMPMILAPGEHKLVARAAGYQDVERVVQVASGDDVQLELSLPPLPPPIEHPAIRRAASPPIVSRVRRFSVGAGFGTNLGQLSATGAPSLDLGLAVTSRLELGVSGVLVAYAVMPSLRVRLMGDAVAIHVIAAMPVALTDGAMTSTFVAGAGGLGLTIHAAPAVAFRIETLVSYAGHQHGTTVPTFVGGQLWF